MVVFAYNRNKEVVVATKPRSNMLFTLEKTAQVLATNII
jgi:hypothetical protein